MTSTAFLTRPVVTLGLMALVVPLTVAPFPVDAVVTTNSTIHDNTLDTAGYRSTEIGPHNGIAAPVSGSDTFTDDDQGYVGIDLLGIDVPQDALPRTRAGDKIVTAFTLPDELTADSSPVPSGSPAAYDNNWCDPADDLGRDWIRTHDCHVNGNDIVVTTTLDRPLQVADWDTFTVRIGVVAAPKLTQAAADVTAQVILPTDNQSTPARTATIGASFALTPNQLGIYDLALVSNGGSPVWAPTDTGYMEFSVLPQDGTAGPIDIRKGEYFTAFLSAYNPSRDDAAAGNPRRGGLELMDNEAHPDNPCSHRFDPDWMPGFMIECTHPGGSEAAPESALVIQISRLDASAEDLVLPRTYFRIPVTNTYRSATEADGADGSTADLYAGMLQPATGPRWTGTSVVLGSSNTLGVYNLEAANLTRFGSSGFINFRLSNPLTPIRVRQGDTYSIFISLVNGEVAYEPRSGSTANACDTAAAPLLPGFTNECIVTPGPATTEVEVRLTRTDPDADVTLRNTAMRIPAANQHRGTGVIISTEVTARFHTTSDQPSLGPVTATASTTLQPPGLALGSTGLVRDSGGSTRDAWNRGEKGWLNFSPATTDDTKVNVHTGDWFEVTFTGPAGLDSTGASSGVGYILDEPGSVCADQTPDGLWQGWTVSCTTSAISPGSTDTNVAVLFTRTGPDDENAHIPNDVLSLRVYNAWRGTGTPGDWIGDFQPLRMKGSMPDAVPVSAAGPDLLFLLW